MHACMLKLQRPVCMRSQTFGQGMQGAWCASSARLTIPCCLIRVRPERVRVGKDKVRGRLFSASGLQLGNLEGARGERFAVRLIWPRQPDTGAHRQSQLAVLPVAGANRVFCRA